MSFTPTQLESISQSLLNSSDDLTILIKVPKPEHGFPIHVNSQVCFSIVDSNVILDSLKSVKKFCNDHGASINPDKTTLLSVMSNCMVPKPRTSIHYGDNLLKSKDSVKLLGYTLSHDLKQDNYVNSLSEALDD
jgi:hypothetical protein